MIQSFTLLHNYYPYSQPDNQGSQFYYNNFISLCSLFRIPLGLPAPPLTQHHPQSAAAARSVQTKKPQISRPNFAASCQRERMASGLGMRHKINFQFNPRVPSVRQCATDCVCYCVFMSFDTSFYAPTHPAVAELIILTSTP